MLFAPLSRVNPQVFYVFLEVAGVEFGLMLLEVHPLNEVNGASKVQAANLQGQIGNSGFRLAVRNAGLLGSFKTQLYFAKPGGYQDSDQRDKEADHDYLERFDV